MNYQQYTVLMHHGIKGQRWGVENGPPYPLDKAESRRIKAEARLKKQKDRAEEKIRKTMQRHPDLTYEEAARLRQTQKEKRKEVAIKVLKTTASTAIKLGAAYAGLQWLSGPVGSQILGDIVDSVTTAANKPKATTINSILDKVGNTPIDASTINSALYDIGNTSLDIFTRASDKR